MGALSLVFDLKEMSVIVPFVPTLTMSLPVRVWRRLAWVGVHYGARGKQNPYIVQLALHESVTQ